ncbi:hypothetical protein E2I00_013957 [Balaenoptera physalus]|uniref:Gem-associated protein 8 n=1 Tax=Balaenoptera physalus TaxID=9770 RepID=A0A643C778_BALPH|nr:hypothetical protein E2I00_013957 [Balaenoptera physalus]
MNSVSVLAQAQLGSDYRAIVLPGEGCPVGERLLCSTRSQVPEKSRRHSGEFRRSFGPSQSEMAAEPATAQALESWSSHPVYARYWQHYHQAMAWMRSHQNAYRKAVKSFSTSPWHYSAMGPPQSAYAKKGRRPQPCYKRPPASRDSHRRHSRAGGRGPHPRGREQPAWSAEAEKEKESESDDGGIECDVSNMEITEELRHTFSGI